MNTCKVSEAGMNRSGTVCSRIQFNFWNWHGIMNTSGLLQRNGLQVNHEYFGSLAKEVKPFGFMLTLQET